MNIPTDVNLKNSLLNKEIHLKWKPTGGNDGGHTLSHPYEKNKSVPSSLIVTAYWKLKTNDNIGLGVKFQGMDEPEPKYTIDVYNGVGTIEGDLIERKRNIYAKNVISETKNMMEKYANHSKNNSGFMSKYLP